MSLVSRFLTFIGKILLISAPILLAIIFRLDILEVILCYIFWAQAEIALRQNTLFSVQFEPSFKVALDGEFLIIKNISQNPAYNVAISRVLYKNKPVSPEKWSSKIDFPDDYPIQCLSPGERSILCIFHPGALENFFIGKNIEVWYTTRIGESREIYITPLAGINFLITHPRRELPGWLLKTLEELRFLVYYVKVRFKK